MAKVDDLGIELDEDLERLLADPKSANVAKAVNYFMTRHEKQKMKEHEEKKKTEKKDSMFGGMFE